MSDVDSDGKSGLDRQEGGRKNRPDCSQGAVGVWRIHAEPLEVPGIRFMPSGGPLWASSRLNKGGGPAVRVLRGPAWAPGPRGPVNFRPGSPSPLDGGQKKKKHVSLCLSVVTRLGCLISDLILGCRPLCRYGVGGLGARGEAPRSRCAVL
ncbi:hypothetical protein SKAU_G00215950 [Synaphobranchus kaupii]|uniref:Uncharacterized protein n=1 Tax=Synaphobranchus kaupii TaxID=118154 RepID=A0A9Q1FA99_SYNKA|nr:hypothetical protein SKAU_G00215950 [Synaphobranchus kaupii]